MYGRAHGSILKYWPCAASAFLLAACTTASGAPETSPEPATREEAISEIAAKALEKKFAPGILIRVRGRDGVLYSDIRGHDDIETGRPLREDSLFRMYSMTKPVTTAAAMMLVEDGTLSLEDPVMKWIPAFGNATVYESGALPGELKTQPLRRPILVRDLMQHTAGLGYPFSQADVISTLFVARGIETGSRADPPPSDGRSPPASLEEMADRMAGIPLRTQPGEAFTYGNATDVLGRVIEAATGQRLSAVLEQRLFTPLGMTDTYFSVPESARDRLTSAYSAVAPARAQDAILDVAHIDDLPAGALVRVDEAQTSPFARPYPIDFGGAGLISTAEDYLRFSQMIANGGELGGVRVLSERAVSEMLTGSLPDAARETPGLAGNGLDFGLGFAVLTDPGRRDLNIPAGTAFWGGAASTIFWVDPHNEISGVILTQVFGGDFRAAYLAMIDAWYAAPDAP